MDCIKIAEFIPAILILISIMTIVLIVILKYGNKIFDGEYKISNALLFVSAFLFIIILIAHLFKEQTWTADTLKILIGTSIGAGSIKLSRKKSENNSSVNNSGTIEGDVAGRDINKNIENIKNEILEIKDSVSYQNERIGQISADINSDNDYVINTIYVKDIEEIRYSISKDIRGPGFICRGISNIIKFWHDKGWKLKHFCSDIKGMECLFLIFEKPKRSEAKNIEIYCYHGSDTSNFKEYVQDEPFKNI